MAAWGGAAAATETDAHVPFVLLRADRGGAIDADADGVFVIHGGAIERIDLAGRAMRVAEAPGASAWPLLATADNAFLLNTYRGMRKFHADGSEPVSKARPVHAAFGPDGALYTVVGGWKSQEMQRFDPATRTASTVLPSGHDLSGITFSPSGTLHVLANGSVARIANGSLQTVLGAPVSSHPAYPTYFSAIAFDAADNLYVAQNRDNGTDVLRIGAQGESTQVARLEGGQVVAASFGGTKLFVSYVVRPGWQGEGVGYFDLGVPGFEGFESAFALPPAGDLVVSAVEVVREAPLARVVYNVDNDVNEVRKVRVTVTNAGAGPVNEDWQLEVSITAQSHLAAATHAASYRPGHRGSVLHTQWMVPHEGVLPSGRSVTFEFLWDTTLLAGEFFVAADADPYDTALETVEGWFENRGAIDVVVRTTL